MHFAILFQDEVSRAEEVRQQYTGAHLDFPDRDASATKAAGPLRDGDGTPDGGLWVVQAADREQVERLVREDPFWPTGLRRSMRVLAWTQVFADRVRGSVQA